MNVYSLIRHAITHKLVVLATYQGHRRELCPHVLGTKNGRAKALFYQVGGTSERGLGRPGSAENWRCMVLDEMEHVSVREGGWRTGPHPAELQACVEDIDVTVNY